MEDLDPWEGRSDPAFLVPGLFGLRVEFMAKRFCPVQLEHTASHNVGAACRMPHLCG